MLIRMVCVFILAFSATVSAHAQEAPVAPKNVILMISDGCGYNHIAATGLFFHGKPDGAIYHAFDVKLAMSTFPANGSYDPDKAWTDFDYVKTNPTDSAAAATAMATGVKTKNGMLAMDPEGKKVLTILERAEEMGKATGVVSTVLFTSATPAAFVAHNNNRNDFGGIGKEMLLESFTDVILGAGHPFYDGGGNRRAGDFTYTGAPGMWWEPVTATANAGAAVDADHNGVLDDAWTVIHERKQFRALISGEVPKRVFGLAQVPMATQQERAGNGNPRDDRPLEVPFIESSPTLAEMTAGALNVLDDDPDGFFLAIEGGAVDAAAHSNQSGRMIEEQHDFDLAVEAVVKWVEANSSWADTLVIVTGDHETGYLTTVASDGAPTPWAFLPLTGNKTGEMPTMQWNSGNHTNSLIRLFAKGAGAQQFMPRATKVDPQRGPYVDNTDIGQVVFELWKTE